MLKSDKSWKGRKISQEFRDEAVTSVSLAARREKSANHRRARARESKFIS